MTMEALDQTNTVDSDTLIEFLTRLKYPELRFPYEALPPGRFKDLVDKACENGPDAGLITPAILALASSVPLQDEMDGDRINFDVCLLALVGAGKDVSMKRAIKVLGMEEGQEVIHYAPNGERAVAVIMGDKPGAKKGDARTPGFPRLCMVTPEMEETLKKSKSETSAVLQALQYFYDYNEKTISDDRHGGHININCRLSWLTALPVGAQEIDTNAFKRAFGENAAHGIASRMIFGFSERRVDPRFMLTWRVPYEFNHFDITQKIDVASIEMGNDDAVIQEVVTKETLVSRLRRQKVEGFAPGVRERFLAWAPETDMSGRDFQHVHKVSILCALLQDNKLIEQEDWDFAKAFTEWQGAIRRMFSSGSAQTLHQAEFNEMVMDQIVARVQKLIKRGQSDKYTKIVEEDGVTRYYVYWNKIANGSRWFKFGMDAPKTIHLLVGNAALAYLPTGEQDQRGEDLPNKAWVRVVNLKELYGAPQA